MGTACVLKHRAFKFSSLPRLLRPSPSARLRLALQHNIVFNVRQVCCNVTPHYASLRPPTDAFSTLRLAFALALEPPYLNPIASV
ncbi:hypothetical protein K443DRAFT_678255 [Laccaria amethystina LaAM-08-1]|uniref:Uncharacterized protein n=1 Tax=Laccaria amethystina LaAM-08-1 TaxID=1095629 RepID=A0A0C9X9C3_9AGAR|nr:hypothetical protein K443DRAFT_678255 [Laccaria amethystina LaAM-08-1]